MLRFLSGSLNGRGRVVYSWRNMGRMVLYMAVSRDASCIVATFDGQNSLSVFSTSEGVEPRGIAGFRQPTALSFAPDDRLYVQETERVSVLAPASLHREAVIDGPFCTCGVLSPFALTTSADAVFIAHYSCGSVAVYNRATLVWERTFKVQTQPFTKICPSLALICRDSVLAAPLCRGGIWRNVNLCDLEGAPRRLIECGLMRHCGTAWSEDDELVTVSLRANSVRLTGYDAYGFQHRGIELCSERENILAVAVRNGVVYALMVDTRIWISCVGCTMTIVEFCGGGAHARPFALTGPTKAAQSGDDDDDLSQDAEVYTTPFPLYPDIFT